MHHGKEFGVYSNPVRRPKRLGQCKEWSKLKLKIALWFQYGECLEGMHDGTLGNQKATATVKAGDGGDLGLGVSRDGEK